MKKLMKVFETLRTHWKKSTFAAAGLTYLAHWADGQAKDNELRRNYCLQAKMFGEQLLAPGEKPRIVTVLLNPASQKGKGKQVFEKNSEAMLHLAGLQVNMLRSERQGHVQELVEKAMSENTDAIIVAGGDGTVLEAITGMLRLLEKTQTRCKPIGVIPTGQHNTLANSLYKGFSQKQQIRLQGEAVMAVIRGMTKQQHVIKVEGGGDKATFFTSYLQWGPLCDARENSQKFRYLGPLKCYASHLAAALKKVGGAEAELEYLNVCKGCSNCSCKPKETKSTFFRRLTGGNPLKKGLKDAVEDRSGIENVDCGKWHAKSVKTSDFQARLANDSIEIWTGPEELSTSDFVKQGKSNSNSSGEPEEISKHLLSCREFKLRPKAVDTERENWLTIDSERFELKPFHATLISKHLQVFVSPDA